MIRLFATYVIRLFYSLSNAFVIMKLCDYWRYTCTILHVSSKKKTIFNLKQCAGQCPVLVIKKTTDIVMSVHHLAGKVVYNLSI